MITISNTTNNLILSLKPHRRLEESSSESFGSTVSSSCGIVSENWHFNKGTRWQPRYLVPKPREVIVGGTKIAGDVTQRNVKRDQSCGSWSFRDSVYSPAYGFFADKSRRLHSATTRATNSDARDVGSDTSSDLTHNYKNHDRSSRVAALFAALFIITLLLAISFITFLAILTDGFSAFNGNSTCTTENNSNYSSSTDLSSNTTACLTEECVRLAASYLGNMNPSVDPCTNFYDFACGRYEETKAVPEYERKVTILSEMKRNIDQQIKGILERSSRENASKTLRVTQIFFDSCMDKTSQEEMGILPMTSLLSAVGGWPLLTNARFDSTDYQWESLQAQLAGMGIDGMFRIFAHKSFEDSTKYILMFSPPRLFLEKKRFYRDSTAKSVPLINYKEYMSSLLELLGADMEDESGVIDYQIRDIIDFERRIANLTRSESARNHSSLNNLMTYGSFKNRFPQINWDAVLGPELLPQIPSESTLINVLDIKYFDGLAQLIKTKPLNSMHNFLMWSLVSGLNTIFPLRYRKPLQKFRKTTYGTNSQLTSTEECVKQVKTSLSLPVSALFAQMYFSSKQRHTAEELMTDIRRAMKQTLLNTDWMDEETRTAAMEKLQNMDHKIGYPDWLLNETEVLAPLAGVRLTANQYFDNVIALRKASVRHGLSRVNSAVQLAEWPADIFAVDAFHYLNGNEIIFPAGILQWPMFVDSAPFASNYGAVGMGLAHEVSHAFDDLGAQYDANGVLSNWWNEATTSTFARKKQCFIAQYNNQVEPNSRKKVNGVVTLGENIADNGGVRIAYQALQLREARRVDDAFLPGLEKFTQQQMFFLAFANTWCEAVKPSAMEYVMETDVHALGRFRVNVPLQNFPAFSQTFNCSIGSPMNPFEKCRIW